MQQNRYQGNHALGLDVKSNQKRIRITPGPSDYHNINYDTSTGVAGSAVNRITHNHSLNNGGLQRPQLMSHKDLLLLKSYEHMNKPKGRTVNMKLKGIRTRGIKG